MAQSYSEEEKFTQANQQIDRADSNFYTNFSTYINRNLCEKDIRKMFYSDYSIGSQIGKGGFGTIFSAVRRKDQLPVAVKVIKKAKVTNWFSLETRSIDNDFDRFKIINKSLDKQSNKYASDNDECNPHLNEAISSFNNNKNINSTCNTSSSSSLSSKSNSSSNSTRTSGDIEIAHEYESAKYYDKNNNHIENKTDIENSNQIIYTWKIPLEIALMIRVRHIKNCIKIIDYLEQKNCFIIIMERIENSKDLFDLISDHANLDVCNGLSEPVVKDYFRQIVETIEAIQKCGIYHLDIKDENILINLDTNQIKLIDFGAGMFFTDKSEMYNQFHGTRVYSPPEWILDKCYQGDKATVWSLGVLLFNMTYGDIPWEDDDDIINCRLNSKRNLNSKLGLNKNERSRNDKHVDDLISLCLNKNQSERIELENILKHEWISN
jgi:serine/threonine protein kinase